MKKLIVLLLICLPLYANNKGGTHGGGKGKRPGSSSTLVITIASLNAGSVGVAYSDTVDVSGGTAPYTYTLTGSLPTSLSLNTSTGAITGTPSVAGTYSFIITVTDSSSPVQTYAQAFSIAIAGLSISVSPASLNFGNQQTGTTSVAGIVTLTNTGTTTALSITSIIASTKYAETNNCGSSLGAGLSCTVNVTFQPTALGLVSGTLTLTDSASTSPQTVTLTGTGVAANTTYFSDGFETGCLVASCSSTSTSTFATYFPAWSGGWGITSSTDSLTVQNSVKNSGSYAYGQRYQICGASDGTCGASSQDINRYVRISSDKFGQPSGLTHFFVTGYVYIKTPEADATQNVGAQRKLIRLTDVALDQAPASYEVLLDAWSYINGIPANTNRLSLYCSCGIGAYGPSTQIYGIGTIPYDTWTKVEMEVQLNTPGLSDGIVRLWVGSSTTPVYQNTALPLRNYKTTNITAFAFGAQTNRYNFNIIDEYRYWDDISITSAYQ